MSDGMSDAEKYGPSLSKHGFPVRCNHSTGEEIEACNRCTTLHRIALGTKRLLEVRRRFLAALLTPGSDKDALQVEMEDWIRKLERDIELANSSNLWDPGKEE